MSGLIIPTSPGAYSPRSAAYPASSHPPSAQPAASQQPAGNEKSQASHSDAKQAADRNAQKRFYSQLSPKSTEHLSGEEDIVEAKRPRMDSDDDILIANSKIPQLAGVLQYFPEQKKRYAQLLREGWNIQIAESELQGTYCRKAPQGRKGGEIRIAPSKENVPISMLISLAHEMGHAIYPSEQFTSDTDFAFKKKMNEGHSMLCEYKLIGEVTDEDAKAYLMAELKTPSYADKALKIYEKWEKACKAAEGDEEKIKQADYDAKAALGDIYKNRLPSGYPNGVTYEEKWRVDYNLYYGDLRQSKLMKELAERTPPLSIADTTGKLSPPSYQNIAFAHRLRRQEKAKEPKTIFITKTLFAESLNGHERVRAETIVNNALNYGNLKFQKSSKDSNEQHAILSFDQKDKSYEVHLKFDLEGRVSHLAIFENEMKSRSLPLLMPVSATAPSTAVDAPIDPATAIKNAAHKNRGKIHIDLPRIFAQKGHTCKPVILAIIDNYYSTLLKIPNIPAYKDKKDIVDIQSNKYAYGLPRNASYRQDTKEIESEQGEILQHEDFESIARKRGFAPKAVSPESVDDFMRQVDMALSQGHPLAAFFAVSHGEKGDAPNGHPSLIHPENEHACVIVGVNKRSKKIDIAHWGKLYSGIPAADFYNSMNILPETREPEFYKNSKYSSGINKSARRTKTLAKYDLVKNAEKMVEKKLEHAHLLMKSITPRKDSGFRNRMYVLPPDASHERWGMQRG